MCSHLKNPYPLGIVLVPWSASFCIAFSFHILLVERKQYFRGSVYIKSTVLIPFKKASKPFQSSTHILNLGIGDSSRQCAFLAHWTSFHSTTRLEFISMYFINLKHGLKIRLLLSDIFFCSKVILWSLGMKSSYVFQHSISIFWMFSRGSTLSGWSLSKHDVIVVLVYISVVRLVWSLGASWLLCNCNELEMQ